MPDPESAELVSVDEDIDEIAREALAEAQRREEAEKCRNAGPIFPPVEPAVAPK